MVSRFFLGGGGFCVVSLFGCVWLCSCCRFVVCGRWCGVVGEVWSIVLSVAVLWSTFVGVVVLWGVVLVFPLGLLPVVFLVFLPPFRVPLGCFSENL